MGINLSESQLEDSDVNEISRLITNIGADYQNYEAIIRAARGRNQIVLFSSLLEGLRPCAMVVQKKLKIKCAK
jgi:hypothetical protein